MDLLILMFPLSYQKVRNINHNVSNIGLSIYKNKYMKLIYIKSTMEPKNYSTIRSILKKEQGEKIAPYVFKINDTQTLQEYLDQEKITYEIYQEEQKIVSTKRALTPTHDKPKKKRKLEEM